MPALPARGQLAAVVNLGDGGVGRGVLRLLVAALEVGELAGGRVDVELRYPNTSRPGEAAMPVSGWVDAMGRLDRAAARFMVRGDGAGAGARLVAR